MKLRTRKITFAKSSVDECEFLWIWLKKYADSDLNHLKIFASANGADDLMANDEGIDIRGLNK
jgi:hypothetical protein